jgi:hypothetical protein
MVKLGLADSAQPVGSADLHKYESLFAYPLLESKHEAFKDLFQDDSFPDDFAPEVDTLLA